MSKKVFFKDLGIKDYGETWALQEELFGKLQNNKQIGKENDNYLIFVEHPHVFTLGKSGQENNLLISNDFLKKIDATYYRTNRGGDITYHGYGQIVAYPIIDLENFGLGARTYIEKLEEVIIQTLKEYDIKASRLKGATGVWIDPDNKNARKICAIGVRLSRFITMHGFAFNINTNLDYFGYINPCGITDKGVTSLAKELNKKINIEDVKQKLLKYFEKIFDMKIIQQKDAENLEN